MRRLGEFETETDLAQSKLALDDDEHASVEAADQSAAQHQALGQVQMRFGGDGLALGSSEVREAAAEGVREAPTSLPHADRIQASFGSHDVSSVKAHVGGRAAQASEAIGAQAFATGSSVGFAETPDLHTAAHEAAHVVQQRRGVQLRGGVGESGDQYEQNADAVADRVVAGRRAEDLLDSVALAGSGSASAGAVQRKPPVPKVKPWLKNKKKKKTGPPKPKSKPWVKQKGEVVEKPAEKPKKKKIGPPKPKSKPWAKPKEEPRSEVIHIDEKPRDQVEDSDEEETTETKSEEKTTETKSEEETEAKSANQEAMQRIETGVEGVAFVEARFEERAKKGNVDTDWDAPKEEEEEEESAPAPKKNKGLFSGIKKLFKGFRNLFKSKLESSSEDEKQEIQQKSPIPLPPQVLYAYDKAAVKLGELKVKLGERIARLDDAKTAIADKELPGAKQDCDNTADHIKVAPRHESWLRDIGDGILHGTQKMVENVLARGDTKWEALKVRKKLGKGGSGATVFRTDYLGVAPMAYKLGAGKDLTGKKQDTEDLEKESRIMRQFSHPNILKSGGITHRSGNAGVLMEFAGHGDLESVKKKMAGKLTKDEKVLVTRYLMRGAFRGLRQLHESNEQYVHADIKDQNFLLGDDLQPKLMDFGFSEGGGEVDATHVGTSVFMAPEVVTGKPKQKSDIWSMGEMVLQLTLGTDSVNIQEDDDDLDNYNKEFKRVGMTNASWHPKFRQKTVGLKGKVHLDSFVQQVMQKDPNARPTAAQALGHPFLVLGGTEEAAAIKLLEEKVLGTKPPSKSKK